MVDWLLFTSPWVRARTENAIRYQTERKRLTPHFYIYSHFILSLLLHLFYSLSLSVLNEKNSLSLDADKVPSELSPCRNQYVIQNVSVLNIQKKNVQKKEKKGK